LAFFFIENGLKINHRESFYEGKSQENNPISVVSSLFAWIFAAKENHEGSFS